MFSPLYKSAPLTCSFGEAFVAFRRCGAFSGSCFDVLYFDVWLQSWGGSGSRGGCRFRPQFQMDENEGGKSSIKPELWEAQLVLGSRANTIMHDQSARSRITGQLGLKSCLSEVFFFPLELLQFLLWTNGNGLKLKTDGEMLNFRHCFHADSPFVARGKMFCCF